MLDLSELGILLRLYVPGLLEPPAAYLSRGNDVAINNALRSSLWGKKI